MMTNPELLRNAIRRIQLVVDEDRLTVEGAKDLQTAIEEIKLVIALVPSWKRHVKLKK